MDRALILQEVAHVAGGFSVERRAGGGLVPRLDCLECVVLGTSVLIPTQHLDRVMEYSLTAPVPLSQSWVGGLGLVDGALWISLALAGEPRGPLSGCKGVLLLAPDKRNRYAVQVESVGAIASVEPGVGVLGPIPWPCPVAWFAATTHAGHDVLRLDTDAVAAALFASGVSTPAGSGA